MEVQSVSYDGYGQQETILLRPPYSEAKPNCFTVINGVNGTGKSAILRIISDAALGLESSRQSKLFARDIKISIVGKISRTIALSGTHNDRFPLNSGIEIRQNMNQFDLLRFYYYGPKQSGNYTSVYKAANTIAHSLLSFVEHPYWPKHSLISLLQYLGFEPAITLSFELGNRFKGGRYTDYLRSLGPSLGRSLGELNGPSKLPETILESIKFADRIVSSGKLKEFFRPSKRGKSISLDLASGPLGIGVYGDEFFDFIGAELTGPRPQLLADLIALGVLSTRVSLVRRWSGRASALDELSSGEWQLIYSLLNLAINVEDNSLILIDEPENSLHPQWQCSYVSLVRELVSHRKGCHVIVATHSPLIAASLMPEDGNLVRLERRMDGGDLQVAMEESAYGWLPEDVLKERFDMESVRPPELTRAINNALRLLKFSSEPSLELKEAANKIHALMKFLPRHDPLFSVLNAVVKIAFKDETK